MGAPRPHFLALSAPFGSSWDHTLVIFGAILDIFGACRCPLGRHRLEESRTCVCRACTWGAAWEPRGFIWAVVGYIFGPSAGRNARGRMGRGKGGGWVSSVPSRPAQSCVVSSWVASVVAFISIAGFGLPEVSLVQLLQLAAFNAEAPRKAFKL